ncbi:transporter substrate-binding domain-containing protein [Legionella impletisoli]|uniref:Arginine ABC transporter substrate-binding protein n=1 Tax=Legionella impletisoli TaxID=343510 RepID=A0A917JW09_9GAMM|nr:transporter substrate-binding domain-containing protein [Legionella impletisoli]GGI87192.1 arginine ABC transporter substrate-binding protein [Legionella impletisoli]
MSTKLLRLLVLFLLIGLLPSVYAQQALKVGIPPYIPPFVMTLDKKDQYVGFDISLMNEICRRLGYKCTYYPMSSAEIFAAVGSNVLDLGVGNITITSEEKENYLFSLPYLESYAQYISLKSYNYTNYMELKGKQVGIHLTYLYEPLLFQDFGDDITIKYYGTITDMLDALSNHKIDGIIMDAAVAEALYANDETIALLGEKIPYGLGYGILANKSRSDLIDQINRALLLMETDGTYLKFYNVYFGNMNY